MPNKATYGRLPSVTIRIPWTLDRLLLGAVSTGQCNI
jgi:hypothetical protein